VREKLGATNFFESLNGSQWLQIGSMVFVKLKSIKKCLSGEEGSDPRYILLTIVSEVYLLAAAVLSKLENNFRLDFIRNCACAEADFFAISGQRDDPVGFGIHFIDVS
jgi:hypothetical protein